MQQTHSISDSRFPLDWCRSQFPALAREVGGRPVVYFDGPGGSQTPRRVIDAVAGYLGNTNANVGGQYVTSRESDAMLETAHRAVAEFLGTAISESVIFGANMTTLTFALSRALARTWKVGDEIIVMRLDHDANVTPWVLAARDAGATVRTVDINANDCTLNLDELDAALSPRTRLVAVGCASNIVGTINPVGEICRRAHAVGAQVFLDAVHFAPHCLPEVTAWNCDFAACSAYKFFGPHVGVLWGRPELLKSLTPYKLRPVTESLPGRWMTGTQNHEGIAGTLAAIDYLTDLGREIQPQAKTRRDALVAAYDAIGKFERDLCARLLDSLAKIDGLRVLGITDRNRLHERTPTVSFVHVKKSAAEIAQRLGEQGLFVGNGNFYALQVTEALGLEPNGVVRVGLMHYTTPDEVDQLLAAISALE